MQPVVLVETKCHPRYRWYKLTIALGALSACTGTIAPVGQNPAQSGAGGSATGAQGGGAPAELPSAVMAAQSAPRRLTSEEYDNALLDLLGDETRGSALVLPPDLRTPYDNDYSVQIASQALVEGAELLAADAIARLRADTKRRDRLVGCKPMGPDDSVCLRSFVERVGRRILRRPLSKVEVDELVALRGLAVAGGDFHTSVDAVLRVLLQDPEFLYRIEVGSPVPGQANVRALDEFEAASRLAFLLWGSGPDDRLLDAAQAGKVISDLRSLAEGMLGDARARRVAGRFHAQWLTWERAPLSAELRTDMRAETQALLDRVLFEQRGPWADLLRMEETFVTPALAKHYGLTYKANTPSAWTSYAGTDRRGLLSHGSFLAAAGNVADTSPTRRGKMIRERLFCQTVPPPPPNANADEPPKGDAHCKKDLYTEHRAGTCAGCHALMDPIGFGLENYDLLGHYRTTDNDKPECKIEGQGELIGIGTFKGPAQLSDLMVGSGLLGSCLVSQLYSFATGHGALTSEDVEAVEALVAHQGKDAGTDVRYHQVLLDLAASPAFVHRRLPTAEVSR